MEIFIIWIVLSALVAHVAAKKGRSEVGYFFLSLLLSPIIGLIAILVAGDNEEGFIKNGDLKKCPACAELVKLEAIKCKHCGHNINEDIKIKSERSITSADIAKIKQTK